MTHALKVDHRVNRLLFALDPEEFRLLEPHLEAVQWQRGKILYDTGDTIHYAYFPHDTFVSLVTVLEDGNTVEMAGFGREGVIGMSSAMFTRQAIGRYIVQLDGTASRLCLQRLHDLMNTRPDVRALFLRFSEALFGQAFQTVACNAVHSVEARCCRWILNMHDRVDQDMLPLTHEILGDMLGVQRSSVSVVARALQTAGFISQRRGFIVVTNRSGLEKAACECYSRIRKSYERLLPQTFPKTDASSTL
jgi:CRP-like cAMP-binding protein